MEVSFLRFDIEHVLQSKYYKQHHKDNNILDNQVGSLYTSLD